MTLLIRSWKRWQGSAVGAVMRSRKSRDIPLDNPLAMTSFSVSSTLWSSAEFTSFARALQRPRDAEAFLCRIFARVALTAAKTGELHVDRAGFAAVLTTPLDPVPRVVGERVFDALLASGIAAVVTSPVTLPVTLRPGDDRGADLGAEGSGDTAASAPSRALHTRGHARVREAPQPRNGSAVTLPVTSPDTSPVTPCEESRVEFFDPPPPGQGGTSTSSRSAPHNGHDAAPRPLRRRERERFGKVLDYAVVCGTTTEQATARVDREAHRRQPLEDDRIVELLAGRYAWVTRPKLARWLAEGRVGWRKRRDAAASEPTRVTARAVELCPRHGRAMPCTTCEVVEATPADPQRAKAEIQGALERLSRRTLAAVPQASPETAAARAAIAADRDAIRLGGDLAGIGDDDPRRDEAQRLVAERPRGAGWQDRARALLEQEGDSCPV